MNSVITPISTLSVPGSTPAATTHILDPTRSQVEVNVLTEVNTALLNGTPRLGLDVRRRRRDTADGRPGWHDSGL